MTNSTAKIRLALVDDHQIVIDGLQALLKGHPQFEFVFASTEPLTVLDQLQKAPVDILLTDVMMPGMSGVEFVKTGALFSIYLVHTKPAGLMWTR